MASGYCHLQLMGAIEGAIEYGFRTLVSVSFQIRMREIKNMASGYCHLQLMGAIEYLEHWSQSLFKLGWGKSRIWLQDTAIFS